MKYPKYLLLNAFLLLSAILNAQYTDVINSNRPGLSTSAYSVGKNVIQGEFGFAFENQEHVGLLTEANNYGLDFAFRYGLFFEQLEINWEGTFNFQSFTFNGVNPPLEGNNSNFLSNVIGVKYLIFDPYKNQKDQKPNLYSWKANNSFKWRDLIPAISVFAGANILLPDNPFFPDDPVVSPKVAVYAQSHISGRWVLIGNIIYDKFTTDDPVLSYIVSVTHNLKNPKWSIFAENQGINSDAFADISIRGGAARLINKNFQIDASVGTNFKNTPSRFFGTIGVSYRLDYHEDELIPIERTIKSKTKYNRKKKKKKGKKKDEKDNTIPDDTNIPAF